MISISYINIRSVSLRMRDHTSLIAWQEAQAVSLAVLALSRDHWKPYAAAAFSQLQRSALSVQLNLAEGYAFTNTPTFGRHLRIAYGSAIESSEILQLLVASRSVPPAQINPILASCRRSQRLILGLIRRPTSGGTTGSEPTK